MGSCDSPLGSSLVELYGSSDPFNYAPEYAGGYSGVAIGRKLWLFNGGVSLGLWFHEPVRWNCRG